ncbi:hypothetical protein [Planktosalinus lacus]|uniref:Phenylalanyl-tRNA synthetase subunit alpha n=1 Tax=Planktosalinus lacus TaxID=1526573 RepID=A0A8J2V7E3_9FLAO|nr:hypothetical protein [Planktosalinus lacus]GGD81293.1 hypothetical protein GCM10011312_02050 [Planktosalinus lacus]
MQKDIEFPEVKDIHIAAVKEWDEAFLNQSWNIHLINNSNLTMEVTIIVSRGFSNEQKTATLRHGLGILEPKSHRKVEFITEEVLPFKNEFLLSFFANGKLYDRTFVFEAYTIKDENLNAIPLLVSEGILAK